MNSCAKFSAPEIPEVELMVADLESQAQIRKLAADFLATKKPLHVLMNNAGMFNMKRKIDQRRPRRSLRGEPSRLFYADAAAARPHQGERARAYHQCLIRSAPTSDDKLRRSSAVSAPMAG